MNRAQLLFICVFIYGVLVLPSLLNELVIAQFGGPGGQPYPLFVPPNQNWQSQPQGQQQPQPAPQQYPQGQPQGQTWQYQQGQPQPQAQYPQQGQNQAQGQQQPQAPQQQYPQAQPQAQGQQQAHAFTTKDGLDLRPPYPMPRDPCIVVKLYMDKYEALTKSAYDSYENQENEDKLKLLWAKPLADLPRDYKLALENWEAAAIICLRYFRDCEKFEWLRFDIVGLCDD